MSGLLPSARRVAETVIAALIAGAITFLAARLAQGGLSPWQWAAVVMAAAIASLTLLLARELIERASRSHRRPEIMSDGLLWIHDDQAGRQPVCPEHRVPIMMWLHSFNEIFEIARLSPDKVDLRQDELLCPGRAASERHEIKLAESDTWSEAWSIAATRLKGQRLDPAREWRPAISAAPTPAPQPVGPPRPNPDVEPVLFFGIPAPMFNATLQRTTVVETPQFGSTARPPQRQRHSLQPRAIINHRVPITNMGAACEVRVKVESIEPEVDGVFLPITPHVARDDPPPTELRRRYKDSLALGRGEMEWLDVVARDMEDASRCYLWNAAYEDAVQEVRLEGTYHLKLKAYAGDVAVEAEYEIYAPPLLARLELRGPLTPQELQAADQPE